MVKMWLKDNETTDFFNETRAQKSTVNTTLSIVYS